MDDMRAKPKTKTMNLSFLYFLRKKWILVLIVLVALSVIIFPSFYGTLIGSWVYNFSSAFTKKLLLGLCI